jgi:hypothetical protein
MMYAVSSMYSIGHETHDDSGSYDCSASVKSASSAGASSSSSYHARWSAADDQRLMQLKTTFADSAKIWKDVSSAMPGRTSTQCRTRWNYKLNPKRKRPRFESNEEYEDQNHCESKMGQIRPCYVDVRSFQVEPCMFTMDELVDVCSFLDDSDFQ